MDGSPDSGPSTPGVASVDHVPSLVSGMSTDGGALARRPGELSADPAEPEGTLGRPRAAASAASIGAEGSSGSTRGSSGTADVSYKSRHRVAARGQSATILLSLHCHFALTVEQKGGLALRARSTHEAHARVPVPRAKP